MQDKTYLLAFCGPPIKSSKWERHQAAVRGRGGDPVVFLRSDPEPDCKTAALLLYPSPLRHKTSSHDIKGSTLYFKTKTNKKPNQPTKQKNTFLV